MWSATDWSDSGMGGTVRLRRRMIYRPACMAIPSAEQRTAVIDLGSNSFRLVVFTGVPTAGGSAPTRSTRPCASAQGLGRDGRAQRGADAARPADDRGVRAFLPRRPASPTCAPSPRARSATRQPRRASLDRARERAGLPVRVLSTAEEALYGFLAAVNSTTIADGAVLDLGGGSLQLVRVARAPARASSRSWPLGAVRMTERFLPDGDAAQASSSRRCARTCSRSSAPRRWLAAAGRPARRHRRHGAQPGLRRAARARAAAYRGAGLRHHARGSRRARRPPRGRCPPSERGACRGSSPARATSSWRAPRWCRRCSRSAASRRSRSPRRACARASSSSRCSRPADQPCSTTSARDSC